MPFTVPNEADAAFVAQARLMSSDLQILRDASAGSGVVSGCAVTAQGSPDMTLAVAAGQVAVAGPPAPVAAGNVTITAADGTNPRIDLVVVSSAGTKSVTAGTAAASPVMPTIPASSVVLAAVYVPASDTAINSNQIIDKQVMLGANLPTFTPLTLGNVVLWYAADRIPGIAHGGAIATLPDLSGNSRDAVQATGGKQPTLRAGVLNGLPVIRFDGVDDWLATGATAFPADSSLTISTVLRKAGAGAANPRFWGLGGAGSAIYDPGTTFAYYANQAGGVTDLGGTNSNWTVLTVVWTSTSVVDGYINGGTATTLDPGDDFSTQQSLILGNSAVANADYARTDIAEVVMVSDAMTTANRQLLERYFGAKYGITVA